MIQVVGDIDKVRIEEVRQGKYFVHEVVEVLTKPKEDGKYKYAIFDVFHIPDLRYLEDAEEELGEETGWYDSFMFVGRMPYLSGITIYFDGFVEERYWLHICGYIREDLLKSREFTSWLIFNDLLLTIRRKVKNEPYTIKKALFISFSKKDDWFLDGENNFIFVYNANDEILFEV